MSPSRPFSVSLSSLLLLLAPFLFFQNTVADECDLANTGSGVGVIETEASLCQTQGEGYYTFSLLVSVSTLGLFKGRGKPGDPSMTTSSVFKIMDNDCKVLGTYGTNKCDLNIDAHIHENFLPYDLIITNEWLDLGGPSFTFLYANGEYKINNNHCGCTDAHSEGLNAAKGCKCAFPIHGQPEKRAIEFKA